MKKLLSSFSSAAGFTLIELLVVIGILGILASALVATIDPFEQLNKAQDTNYKNISVEFLNANLRYYTTHTALVWDSTANGGAGCYSSTDLSSVPLGTLTTCINSLVSEGELKQGFLSFSGLTKIWATEPNPQTGRQNDIIACFKPTSKSQQKDKATQYNQDGSIATNCKSATPPGTADCYWCAQ